MAFFVFKNTKAPLVKLEGLFKLADIYTMPQLY